MKNAVSIASAAAALLGCVPFPHLERESPPVTGSLVANGSPLIGTAVRLVMGGEERSCSQFWRETRTNELGEFAFSQNRRFVPFMLLAMAHSFYEWSVCVQVEDRFEPAIRFKEYTLAGVPGAGPMYEVVVTCDLEGPRLALQPSSCRTPRYPPDESAKGCSCQASEIKP